MWQLFCDDLQATNSSIATISPLQSTVQRQAETLKQYIRLPGSHAATGQDEAVLCMFVIR